MNVTHFELKGMSYVVHSKRKMKALELKKKSPEMKRLKSDLLFMDKQI